MNRFVQNHFPAPPQSPATEVNQPVVLKPVPHPLDGRIAVTLCLNGTDSGDLHEFSPDTKEIRFSRTMKAMNRFNPSMGSVDQTHDWRLG